MSQTILNATSSNFSALSRVVYNRLSTAAGPRIIASIGSRVVTRGMADVGSGLGSHMTDNDEEAIKKAKLRQFKGRSEVSIPDVAGWSEDLASFSEAAVKADRYVGNVTISRLQEVSLSALDQRMRNEEADFQCLSPNYPSQKSKTGSSGMNSTSSNENNTVGGSSSSSTSSTSSTMNAAINAFREKVLSVIANPSSSGSKSSSPSSTSESTEKKSLKAREAECGSNAFEYDSPALRENLDYTLSDGEKNMGRRSGM